MSPIDDSLREELSALLDGALPEPRAGELRRRLESDDALRREYESLRRAVHAVRALPRTPAPPELRARIEAAIAGRPPRAAVFRFGMLAAAASVVIAAGLVYFLRGEQPRTYEATDATRQAEAKDAREELRRRDAPDVSGSEVPEDGLVLREQAAPAAPVAPAADDAGGTAAGRSEGEVAEEEAPPPESGTVRALHEEDESVPQMEEPTAATAAADAVKERTAEGAPAKSKRENAEEQRGAAKSAEPALLRVVEQRKELPVSERDLYLHLLGTLDPAQARQHVLAVFPTDAGSRAYYEARGGAEGKSLGGRSGALPLLAAVTLADSDEAKLVSRILGAAPVPKGEAASTVVTFGAAATPDQLASTIEGTPDELMRIRRWLELVDLGRAAELPVDSFEFAKTPRAKDTEKTLRAILQFRYPPPADVPKPTAPAPAGK